MRYIFPDSSLPRTSLMSGTDLLLTNRSVYLEHLRNNSTRLFLTLYLFEILQNGGKSSHCLSHFYKRQALVRNIFQYQYDILQGGLEIHEEN